MKIAALYDIHGNLPALEAVLTELAALDIDRLVVGGDIMPGPMPREVLCALRSQSRPVDFICGNCETAMLAELAGKRVAVPDNVRANIRWSAEQLRQDLQFIAAWPQTLRIEHPQLGGVLFCHGTPRDENEIFTRLTAEERLIPLFEAIDASLIVCGHTHMQFDRMAGKHRVINARSVGMPFGPPGAYWLLLNDNAELRKTSYDFDSAANVIRTTSYPEASAFAENHVLQPPREEAMLAAMTKAELQRSNN